MMRQAISPRLAIRIFLNIAAMPRSQRDVVVLLPRVLEPLAAQHRQRAAEAQPGGCRLDHVVNEAAAGRDERVGEFLAVFLGARLDRGGVAEIGADRKSTRLNSSHANISYA